MSRGDRLRKLEEQFPPIPVLSPFVEWAATLPIDDMRAVRDYLQAMIDSESEEALLEDPRYLRVRDLLPLAPPLS
ncbi:MAG: hypothetical protein AB7U23_03275 [Dehalococcoidia bacterium]